MSTTSSASIRTVSGVRLGSPRDRRGGTEEDLHDLVAADHAHELTQRTVDEDQDDEPELHGPEVRPDDLTPEMLVGRTKLSHAPPQRKKMLEVVDEHRGADIDRRLPQHVVHERFFGKAIDERKL